MDLVLSVQTRRVLSRNETVSFFVLHTPGSRQRVARFGISQDDVDRQRCLAFIRAWAEAAHITIVNLEQFTGGESRH